jgi:hypothetical protein
MGGVRACIFPGPKPGAAAVIPLARIGFGSKLIERVLAREIGGKAAIDYKIEGVVFTAVAPLPDVEENTTPAEG